MALNCVVLNEIYRPLSFIGKLSSDYGLLSKTKLRGLVSQHQAVYFNSFGKLYNLKS